MKTKNIEEKPIKVVSGVCKGVIFAAMVACLMVGGSGISSCGSCEPGFPHPFRPNFHGRMLLPLERVG
jgi:hypothetical protein